MKIEQHTKLKVEKDGKQIVLDVAPDMPLGLIFDALMELKGYVVDRMLASHKTEQEEADKQMNDPTEDKQDGSDS